VGDAVDALVSDLLDWIGSGRPYAEVMDAWRTSCPRLPVWEEANSRGYLQCRRDAHGVQQVLLTEEGARHLQSARSGRAFISRMPVP
jgi:D-3-phosphoglycerate dehydrogenase